MMGDIPTLALMLITNDAEYARNAIDAGVDRLMVDLEREGKCQRQRGRTTVISDHTMDDIATLRRDLPEAELLVRTNPPSDHLDREIEAAIVRGADWLMLPMWTSAQQVAAFLSQVRGRARVSLLLETPQAMARLPQVLEMADAIEEIHVGLNDLHLGLGLSFMFECVAGGLVEAMASQIRASGVRFGFGGIARLGSGAVPAELVLSEHVRLGSSLVILSRSFHQGRDVDIKHEIPRLREEEARLRASPPSLLEQNRREFQRLVWQASQLGESRNA
jgi:hypothetical protein